MWSAPLSLGAAQAKSYAGKLAVHFAYATNGQSIYAIDMQTGVESELPSYPSPEDVSVRTFATQDEWRDGFAAVTQRP